MGEVSEPVADLIATAWTRALRSMVRIDDLPEKGTPQFEFLTAAAAMIGRASHVPTPIVGRADWATPEVLTRLLEDCSESLERSSTTKNGKVNAEVSGETYAFLADLGIADTVAEQTGISVTMADPSHSTYIVYESPGQGLELHFDFPRYGDVNILLCLERIGLDQTGTPSRTIVVDGDGISEYLFAAGEYFIFDGAASPHGRTPLQSGERITLLSAGLMKTGDKRHAQQL
ncbi:hypothetical protein [Streptosporangium sandarakinum]|uniref:hypothetical protein n=1 Tax=Streptosporangium sandarakinum TaxID=1260955 RepID=UPI00343246D1